MDREANETEETETSQAGNKKHIDGWCQSEEVNERRRRGEKLLPTGRREGSSKRKQDSIKLCQGQFAVNGPLHLAAHSLRGHMLPWASLHCMLGGARPLLKQKYAPVLLCKFRRVNHIM